MESKKFVLLGFNVLFIATTAPAFWGKVNLEILLLRMGVYEWKCGDDEVRYGNPSACESQRFHLSTSFTLAVASMKFGGVILGPLVDRFGPKIGGIFGQALFATGILCLTVSSEKLPLVTLGFTLMGASMTLVYNSTLHICNLFPHNKNLVMALLSSGGDVAVWIFLVLRLIHDEIEGFASVRQVLLAYLLVPALQFILVIWLWPMRPFEVAGASLNEGKQELRPLCPRPRTRLKKPAVDLEIGEVALEGQRVRICTQPQPKRFEDRTLSDDLLSLRYWVFLPMFCLFFFLKTFVSDTVGDSLWRMRDTTPENVSSAITSYSIITGFGFVFAWILGFTSDSFGVPVTLTIVNLFGLITCALSLIPIVKVQWLTFACFTVFKSFVISSVYAVVSDGFGFRRIGLLTGIQQILAGTAVLSNIRVRRIVADGDADFFFGV